jgi:hypothetical protein
VLFLSILLLVGGYSFLYAAVKGDYKKPWQPFVDALGGKGA